MKHAFLITNDTHIELKPLYHFVYVTTILIWWQWLQVVSASDMRKLIVKVGNIYEYCESHTFDMAHNIRVCKW